MIAITEMHFLVEFRRKMTTSEPFVELNEDEESDSNSEEPPSKKTKYVNFKKVSVCKFSWSLPINLSKCMCNFQYLLIISFWISLINWNHLIAAELRLLPTLLHICTRSIIVILARSFISTEKPSKTLILHDFYIDGEYGNLEVLY